MQETLGDVFKSTINLVPPGSSLPPYPDLIKECVQRAAGRDFHQVSYYDERELYVMGRRKGYGLGGDLIILHKPTHNLPDPMLWPALRAEARPYDWFDWVVVRDCHWNDGFEGRPPAETLNKPHDVTIASGKVFTGHLKQLLLERMNMRDPVSR